MLDVQSFLYIVNKVGECTAYQMLQAQNFSLNSFIFFADIQSNGLFSLCLFLFAK